MDNSTKREASLHSCLLVHGNHFYPSCGFDVMFETEPKELPATQAHFENHMIIKIIQFLNV